MLERGKIIKDLREKAGISQEQLAWDSGIEQTHISTYERGKRNPDWKRFNNILDALGYELIVRKKEC